MNIKDYIASGILEAYVLDALPEAERAEVATAIAQHPELAAEVVHITEVLLRVAEENAVAPPVDLQERIWSRIAEQSGTPVAPMADPLVNGGEQREPVTIPFTKPERVRQMRWQYAAIWIALVGSLLANFLMWNQSNKAEQQQLVMQRELDSMQNQQNELNNTLAAYQQERSMLADTAMQTIVLQSAKPGKPMTGMLYWSKAKGEAYIAMHDMPMPPQGMQYQLWVIQDGKPVDMGMIPNTLVASQGMQKMTKVVNSGQAFAISLEKEGGSPTPTMEEIYVMGKVS